MRTKNLNRKKFASNYRLECAKIIGMILKSEVGKPLNNSDKKNISKAIKLVSPMIVGDKFLSDIPIGKKVGKVLCNKIELAKVGRDAIDDLIRDLEYESYPYHFFFERVLKQLKRLEKGRKANFGLMSSFFMKLKDKFYRQTIYHQLRDIMN